MEQEIPNIPQHSIMLEKLHASKRNGNTRHLVVSCSTRKGVSDLLLGYTFSATSGCYHTLHMLEDLLQLGVDGLHEPG